MALNNFLDWYHSDLEHGPDNFFHDAYGRFEDYDTNLSLQSDMVNHALKKVGKFCMENPQFAGKQDEIVKGLKQHKLDWERGAFDSQSHPMNSAPDFHSALDSKDYGEDRVVGIDAGSSKAVASKQNRSIHNQNVLGQFGITPKPKTEGNNVINAIDRFKMKKSLETLNSVLDDLILNEKDLVINFLIEPFQLMKSKKKSLHEVYDEVENFIDNIEDFRLIYKARQK